MSADIESIRNKLDRAQEKEVLFCKKEHSLEMKLITHSDDFYAKTELEKIKQQLVELRVEIRDLQSSLSKASAKNCIVLCVLAFSKNALQQLPEEEFTYLEEYYGSTTEEWKPFMGENSIQELLQEYEKKSGYTIKPKFLTMPENDIMALAQELEPQYQNSVLLADCFALKTQDYRKIAKVFDRSSVGGCLIAICDQTPEKVKIKMREWRSQAFEYLQDYIHNFSERISSCGSNTFIQVDLEVPSKSALFRRLSIIAKHQLKVSYQVAAFEGQTGPPSL